MRLVVSRTSRVFLARTKKAVRHKNLKKRRFPRKRMRLYRSTSLVNPRHGAMCSLMPQVPFNRTCKALLECTIDSQGRLALQPIVVAAFRALLVVVTLYRVRLRRMHLLDAVLLVYKARTVPLDEEAS